MRISAQSISIFKPEDYHMKYSLSSRIPPREPSLDEHITELKTFDSDVRAIANTNVAIDALDKMILSIKDLQSQSKSLTKLLNKAQKDHQKNQTNNQEQISQDAQDLTAKIQEIKTQMQEIFNSATFKDENVFTKDYRAFSQDLKLNGRRLAPSELETNNLEAIAQYETMLDEEKAYATQAKEILEKDINSLMDKIHKNDLAFERLNDPRLQSDDFKRAYASGITLNKILDVIG